MQLDLKMKTYIPAALFMSYGLALTFMKAWGVLPVSTLVLFVFTVAAAAVSLVIIRYPSIIFYLSVLLVITIALMLRFYPERLFGIFNGAYLLFREFKAHMASGTPISRKAAYVFTWLTVFYCSFPVNMILWSIPNRTAGNLLLIMPGTCIFLYFWFYYIDAAYYGLIIFLCAFMLVYSFQKVEEKSRSWVKKGIKFAPEGKGLWISGTLEATAVIMILLLFLPKSFSPVKWQWLEQKAIAVFPALNQMRSPEVSGKDEGGFFSLNTIGYQSGEDLGGPVLWDNSVSLEIQAGPGAKINYLKGSVCDTYENNRWKRSEGSEIPVQAHSLQESAGEMSEFFTVAYKGLDTKTLFTPAENTFGIIYTGDIFRDDAGGYFSSNTVKGTYTIVLLKNSGTRDETRAGLEKYLSVPNSLPQRVGELAQKITASEDTPYSKMKALESFLRANYKYDYYPTFTPMGSDFTDYFLFDLQRGYCTYFATALAVMGRSAGIPTRYVEGFKVDENQGGTIKVKARNAHAWVEAYIPGRGWLLFEPTPIYEPQPYMETAAEQGPAPQSVDTVPESQWEKIMEEINVKRPENQEHYGLERDTRWSGSLPIADSFSGFHRIFPGALLLILTLLLARAFFVKRRLITYFRYLATRTPQARIAEYYRLILISLEILDLGKLPGETPAEYSRRISNSIYYPDADFRELSDAFDRAFYGNKPPEEAEAQGFETFSKLLAEKIKTRKGWLWYAVEKYLKGNIIFAVTKKT